MILGKIFFHTPMNSSWEKEVSEMAAKKRKKTTKRKVTKKKTVKKRATKRRKK